MERTMTVEEKIRRAEQIYERRKQGIDKPIETINISKNNKKDIRLLRKMIIQILVSALIYCVIYIIQSNRYVFSEDFTNKINEILSYDTNFIELYNISKDKVQDIVNKIFTNNSIINKENSENNQENGNKNTTDSNQEKQETNAIGGANEDETDKQNLSQEEQDIANIKNTTSFIKPIDGTITSEFGQRDTATGRVPKNHTGTDIGANLGTKIKSATDGEVVLASEEGDYGKHLKIQIGEVSIIYAHCNSLYVKQGDQVTQGQEIAEVGSTGNSTGPHLHFEIRISERTIDPQKILEL